jgi:DNA-directed RNA polymerase subunit RPC12/RpoP
LSPRDIRLVGDYVGYKVKNKFTAKCGHEWTATMAKVLQGTGCPYCSIKSFMSNRSAVIYVIEFDNFIKYGISNNISRRLTEHNSQNGSHHLVYYKEFQDGAQALRIEKAIKSLFGGRFVNRDMCPNGYTETLNKSLLPDVIRFLEQEIKK